MIAEPLFWYGLVLKMAMTAAIVVSASLAAERSGPFIGALIASLPTAAGAAYIILALEHPPSFIAASAIGSVAAGAAVSIFAATYSALAQRHGLPTCLGVAFVVWFAVAGALRLVDWTPVGAAAVSAAVFAVATPLTRRYRTSSLPPLTARRAYDIPLRAFTAALVVALVTTASSQIGSFASGMFAIFPVVLGSFVLTLHPRVGGKPVASVLAHAQPALIGLSLGFLVVHYLAEPLGSWWAMGVGLVACLVWSALLLVVNKRRA